MIDTDKYTGHTPAPWWCDEDDWRCIDTMITHEGGNDLESVCRVNYREVDYNGKPLPNGPVGSNKATAQLIADAPLLLEEVKRLRKEVERMRVLKLVKENERLQKELKEAEDVIRYALDRVGNDDDAKRVFEDFLEVIE